MKDEKHTPKSDESDFWYDLPESVKSGIERARKQVEEGKVTPHEEVMNKYSKYL